MMEFWNERTPKARKEHTCALCGGKIIRGEKYARETGKWYGDFFTRALHLRCAAFEREYCPNVDNEFTWDDIDEYIREVHCPKCPHYDEEEGCTVNESIYKCAYLEEKFCSEVQDGR